MTDRALLLLQRFRYDLAEKELRQLLARDPNDAHAHALLALSLMEQGKLPEAEGSARQAVQLAPEQPYYHYCLGSVKARKNDLPGARRAVEEALRLNPEDSDYHALRAFIYLRAGHWKKALKAANEGLTHDPTHQNCLNHRAEALVELDRYQDAYQTMGQALQEDPENEQTHANLGWAYLHKGRYQPALEHFREALRLNPNDEYARLGLVEGLKARYFIYRWLWRYSFWVNHLSPNGAWVALMVVAMGLSAVAVFLTSRSRPELALAVCVLFVAIFVVLPRLIEPLYDLLLQYDRYAQYVLSGKEKWSSTIHALLLLGTVLTVVCGAATGCRQLYWLALNPGLLIFPAARVFAGDGKINVGYLTLALSMALLGVLAFGSLTLGYAEKVVLFSGLNVAGFVMFLWSTSVQDLWRPRV